MKKYFNILLIILFLIIEIFILSNSSIVIDSFVMSINICLYNLMPTLFLSILINNILLKLRFDKYIPKIIKNIFKKIFNICDKDVVIFLLSMISGYPNNASMLNNNENLNNLILYTNFTNPIFIIVTTGSIYLKDIKLSIIILISQYISNIIIGFALRNKNNVNNKKYNDIKSYSFLQIYYSSIKNTIYTISMVFSNILFFSVINSLFTNMFNLTEPFNSLLTGIIEFSSGIYNISITNYSAFIKGLIIIIIITFGSFSIHMQIMSINEKIIYTIYLLFRIINIIISIIIYIILFNLIY